MKISSLRVSLAVSLSMFSPLLFAHPGHGSALADGILHPLTGWDHLLAMLGIGLWAARQRGHSRWLIPGIFVALMGLAAWFGTFGHIPVFVEHGIAASVLLIGLLISFSANTSILSGSLIAGLFAVFHGFAHGAEMPDSTSVWQFGSGFLMATILLQAIGFFLGRSLDKNDKLLRAGGAAIAACGGLLAYQGLH